MRKILTLCFLFGSCFSVQAQQSAQDGYRNFTYYRTGRGDESKIKKVKVLLDDKKHLTVKQLTNAEYYLGRMYEEIGKPDSALVHYIESVKLEPNYSVVNRAMAFIYLEKTKPHIKEMNEASAAKNPIANSKAFEKYKVLVKKALPHLEKYQACEPDEDTLAIITNLYKSIKDQPAIATLPKRLQHMGGNCISLLEDE